MAGSGSYQGARPGSTLVSGTSFYPAFLAAITVE